MSFVLAITLLCQSPVEASSDTGSRTDSTAGVTEQQATVCDDSFGAAGLHIIEAKYGAFGTWIDVTKELREQVRDNTLSIKTCNAISDSIVNVLLGQSSVPPES